MLLNLRGIEGTNIFSYDTSIENIDVNKLVKESKVIFEDYVEKGVIKSDFTESRWKVFDGVRYRNLDFRLDELKYTKYGRYKFKKTYSEFMEIIKSYVLSKFGRFNFAYMGVLIYKLKNILDATDYLSESKLDNFIEIPSNPEEFSGIPNTYVDVINILKIFNNDEVNFAIEKISNTVKLLLENNYKKSNPREIADAYSVLLFEEIITNWWNEDANEFEKGYFYPIYLWWKITTIIPLRPTEFTLIPLKCINVEDDKYYLTVRRTVLKGGTKEYIGKQVHYSIEGDYKKYTYEIPMETYTLIKNYIEMTKKVVEDDSYRESKDVLFNGSISKYYERNVNISSKKRKNTSKSMRQVNSDNEFLYQDLESMIRNFFLEILNNRLGFDIQEEKLNLDYILSEEPLLTGKISRIKLGDTRHIAIVNMILGDFNPVLIKNFVDHSDINKTYHYAKNTKEFIKCITYNKFKELKKRDKNKIIEMNQKSGFNANALLIELESGNFVEVDGGRCYSSCFAKGDVTDCLTPFNGIGDCESCDWFISSSKIDLEKRIKDAEELLERESKFFHLMLRDYAKREDDANLKISTLHLINSARIHQRTLVKNESLKEDKND